MKRSATDDTACFTKKTRRHCPAATTGEFPSAFLPARFLARPTSPIVPLQHPLAQTPPKQSLCSLRMLGNGDVFRALLIPMLELCDVAALALVSKSYQAICVPLLPRLKEQRLRHFFATAGRWMFDHHVGKPACAVAKKWEFQEAPSDYCKNAWPLGWQSVNDNNETTSKVHPQTIHVVRPGLVPLRYEEPVKNGRLRFKFPKGTTNANIALTPKPPSGSYMILVRDTQNDLLAEHRRPPLPAIVAWCLIHERTGYMYRVYNNQHDTSVIGLPIFGSVALVAKHYVVAQTSPASVGVMIGPLEPRPRLSVYTRGAGALAECLSELVTPQGVWRPMSAKTLYNLTVDPHIDREVRVAAEEMADIVNGYLARHFSTIRKKAGRCHGADGLKDVTVRRDLKRRCYTMSRPAHRTSAISRRATTHTEPPVPDTKRVRIDARTGDVCQSFSRTDRHSARGNVLTNPGEVDLTPLACANICCHTPGTLKYFRHRDPDLVAVRDDDASPICGSLDVSNTKDAAFTDCSPRFRPASSLSPPTDTNHRCRYSPPRYIINMSPGSPSLSSFSSPRSSANRRNFYLCTIRHGVSQSQHPQPLLLS